MSAGHDAGPALDLLRGPLRRLDARIKVLGLLAFLLTVGLTPNHRLGWLAGWLVLAIGLALGAYVPWGLLLRRLALDLPVLALAGAQAIFGHGPKLTIGPVSLSEPGLEAGAALMLKATIGIVTASAVAASTTAPEVLTALRQLGCPAWFTRLVGLAYRQVSVLADEFRRISLAAALRRPCHPRRAAASTAGRTLAIGLIRATDRADRLQLAADLRCGAANPRSPTPGATS